MLGPEAFREPEETGFAKGLGTEQSMATPGRVAGLAHARPCANIPPRATTPAV